MKLMIENLLSTLKRNCWKIGATVCLATILSCEEDVIENRPQLSSDEIAFSVVSDSTWLATRAASSHAVTKKNAQFLGALGEDSLYISMVEEENKDLVLVEKTDSVDGRGASLIATSFNQFKLTAFLDVNNTYSEYMKNQEVTRNTSNGECTYSPQKYWPHDPTQFLHFFGYAQSKGTPYINPTFEVENADPKVYQGSFDYTLPTPNTTENKDAENQPDLVFAITPNQNKENGTVNLNFQHALSAVVFKIQNIPDAVTVNSISLSGVKEGGSCALQHTHTGINFTWNTESGGTGTYVQTFSGNNEFEADGQPHDITTTESDDCFMMIPHTFSDEAALHINISRTVNETTYEISLTKKLKDLTDKWDPNKKYTYTISLPEEVKVHVDDKVDATNKIKSDLVIKNTGLSPIYVRVAIIGNWVLEKTENGNTTYEVVADWRNTGTPANDDGVFNWGGTPPSTTTDIWRVGPDGYYYYSKEIAPGSTITDKLFESYTLTATAPVPNALLDLTIAVQAIQWNDLETPIDKEDGEDIYIWPSEIIEFLNGKRTN